MVGEVLAIFQENMGIVFFLYGLGFVVLAILLFFKLRKTGKMPLTNAFWMLFGCFLHLH